MKEAFVWEWIDDLGNPVYVGWGVALNGIHPAAGLFAVREYPRTELRDWLCDIPSEPRRSESVPDLAFTHTEARVYCAGRRKEIRKRGFRILSDRPGDTIRGGGTSLRVVDDVGNEHRSVRRAARAHKTSAATVSRLIRDPLSGWYAKL